MLSQMIPETMPSAVAASENFQTDGHEPLLRLLAVLTRHNYQFSAVTPTTHQRVTSKRPIGSADLRDIFGWNLPFEIATLTSDIAQPMQDAGILRAAAQGRVCSTLRVASLGADLFLHSSFPTLDPEAVFFGPDTYRFARFISGALKSLITDVKLSDALSRRAIRILDIGCGSGAGGIVAARELRSRGIAVELILNDINPKALSLAAVNATAAGQQASFVLGDVLATVAGDFDLIVSNPPYLHDDQQRLYRHGGKRLGRALSVRIASESLARLTAGGHLLLYTGVAMVDARDPFLDEMLPVLAATASSWTYEEIDPDVFAEELERPIYASAHRIAAVGLIAQMRPRSLDAS